MGLVDKQSKFSEMVSLLLQYARFLDYQVTLGDAYRADTCLHGHKHSLHRQRLAIDLNIFIRGQYCTKSEDYIELGEFWELIGGSWGGRFNDGNHFSIEHEGMK